MHAHAAEPDNSYHAYIGWKNTVAVVTLFACDSVEAELIPYRNIHYDKAGNSSNGLATHTN